MPVHSVIKACPRTGWIAFFWLAVAVEMRGTDFVRARIDGLTNTGDAMAYVLPAAAVGLTAYFKDGEGAWELAESVGITMAVTVGLKYGIHSRRPNGKPHSFPSGHAAITFSSAEFMRKRYGWEYGVPAYIIASFVGYSRVRAHVHYSRDVVTGAAIGVATTFLLSKPYHGWHVQPQLDAGYRGLSVSRDF
jgi:membrane-associated phospholipid phosphatase